MRAAFLLVILGCANAAPRGPHAPLKEMEEADAAKCRKLGKYSSSSALPGEAGVTQARQEARAKAAAAGANAVVDGADWQTPDSAYAAVQGYECPDP
jgi:hypothetical protein